MSGKSIAAKKAFLANLFKKGPFEGHAFIAHGGKSFPSWEVGDFMTSEKPVSSFLPYIAEAYRASLEYYDISGNDGVPVIGGLNSGTHIYAAAFGAKPVFPPGSNPFAEPLAFSPADADRIKEPAVESCRPLMRVIELAALARRELGPDAVMGPPDMQTGFDTACILWDKTDLFISMVEAPDAVRALAAKCAGLLKKFVRLFYREFPGASMAHCPMMWTPLGPWFSNDECGNMSAEMFESFCLPELISLSEEFGSFGMHCCADANHQFESFKKIPNFYALNRAVTKRAGWEADLSLETLGGPDGPVMIPSGCSPENIPLLLKKAPAGTRFVFFGGGASVDTAKKWLDDARAAAALS